MRQRQLIEEPTADGRRRDTQQRENQSTAQLFEVRRDGHNPLSWGW
ncbi:hypothetical protein [Mobiluncus mulieris]|nr:hypothetical protein [Mobiluncus mulieris]